MPVGIDSLVLPTIENDTELAKTQYLKRELLFASSMVGRCKFKPVLNAMRLLSALESTF